MEQAIPQEPTPGPKRHSRHVSINRTPLSRRTTAGPLPVDDPLSLPPPTPPPKDAFHPPTPSLLSPSTSLAPPSDPPETKDLSHLLRADLYHPLTELDLPPSFRHSAPSPTSTPLPTLLAHGHFRPAATLAASLLSTPPLPSRPHDIFALFYVRLACLVLIGATPLAAQEARALADLESPSYRRAGAEAGSSRLGAHLAPWELRVLVARLGGWGGGRPAVQALCDLASEARAEILPPSPAEKRELWKGRLRDVGVRVAGALVEMGDAAAAARCLEGMRVGDERGGAEEGLLRGKVGLLYLKMGDLRRARACVEVEESGDGVAAPATVEKRYTAILRPLISVAEGDYEAAATQFTALSAETATAEPDPLVQQNLAVCLIYTGRFVEGRRIMESLVDGGHAFGTLLFNLATVYELCSERARGLKLELAGRVAGREEWVGGWEKGVADFKL